MPVLQKLAVVSALALGAATTQAADVNVVYSNVTGDEINTVHYAYDGVFPQPYQAWTDATAYWYVAGDIRSIVFEFDRVYTVKSFVASLDNNDSYAIEFSLDGQAWGSTVDVAASEGTVNWGMDLFERSVVPTPARYARVYATSGDDMYSVGELQVLAAVPEPEAYAMLMAGLGLLGAVARRRRR